LGCGKFAKDGACKIGNFIVHLSLMNGKDQSLLEAFILFEKPDIICLCGNLVMKKNEIAQQLLGYHVYASDSVLSYKTGVM
jgi:hypothetical protein